MRWFWIAWIVLFALGEFVGLFLIKGGSFSEFVWHLEHYMRGQNPLKWSFGHLAIASGSLWLFFHFTFRMWT